MADSEHDSFVDKARLWTTVNPDIWAPARKNGRFRRIANRVLETASSLSILALIVVSPLSFLLSLLFVYDTAGPTFFGPALVTFWAALIAALVLALEKKGYARNFENSDFHLTPTRILALCTSFLAIVGIILLLRLVLGGIQ